MIVFLSFILILLNEINGYHFNGGTITWAPIDPSDNSSSVSITITQSYSWTYPTVSCTTNVPISTGTYSSLNSNLTCVADCSTDGGYSQRPVDILTDCVSYSTSLGVMSSQRSVNITINASAYFYIAYTGSAWRSLNNPSQSGLSWSILSLINLVKRDDGIMNTPPVANVISPQYVIVNTTTEINIPVSDVNDDDIRCRWSVYQPGYRRRREINEDEMNHLREKRQGCSSCNSGTCTLYCSCSCPACQDTTCTTFICLTSPSCPSVSTTTRTTVTTSSFLHPPIDECGDICHTNGLPNDTTLSNCTVSFTGLIAGTWYAIALQVEDFINDTSITPMSSVPVQFLIYVLPTPTCTILPLILPLTDCLQVEIGLSINVTLYAMNLCGSTVTITDILVVQGISGMIAGNVVNSTTNSSLVSVTFTWTPQGNQVGLQELCAIAFNNLFVQSTQYCVTFTVITSTPNCSTTTTTSTIQIPSKSASTISVPLIVGLSLLGLFLSLCLCCCLLYHLLWSAAAARRRRQERHTRDGIRQETDSFFNPLVLTRNLPFKRPSKNYLVHNIIDHRNSTYTYRSSMPTILSPIPEINNTSSIITKRNKDINDHKASNIENSLAKENIPFTSSYRQTTDDSGLIHSRNIENDLMSSPNIQVIKLPRNEQSKILDVPKTDDHLNDINTNPNSVENKDETVNHIKLKTTPRSSIIKVRLSTNQKRRRSHPNDRNTGNEHVSREHSTKIPNVTIMKLRRLSNTIKPIKDHN